MGTAEHTRSLKTGSQYKQLSKAANQSTSAMISHIREVAGAWYGNNADHVLWENMTFKELVVHMTGG